jgi:polyisoprenoid-binding protein YceI
LALFAAYVTFTGIDGINIFKAPVLAMLFVGGMVPVVFSALAMNAVGKAAMEMVYEVRRQFKEIPGIMEGTGKPVYAKCLDISTRASLKEMMLPCILTIGFPIAVILIGKLVYSDNNMLVAEMLGGYMAGVTVSGVLWAIFQNNAGGAWDNAKKSFEAGVEINGEMTYKGSPAHEAAITGDTVGDPFKDTSGPSMNILIKLTCLIGLVVAPILGNHVSTDAHAAKATVEIVTQYDENGDIIEEPQVMYDESGEIITEEATVATPDLNELEGEWILDASHTYVDFSIRHLLATSKGSFQKVSGALMMTETTKEMKIEIDVNSINTNNQKRDDHLRSDEMFDVAKYPTINFKSEMIEKTATGYVAKGQLTIMGVTKAVELPFEYFGKQDTPWGFPSAAFSGELVINKNDYGLTYGGSMLGEEVTIEFAIEMNPPAPAEETAAE